MAEWAASGSKKSCEKCREIWEALPKKVRDKVSKGECEKCPVLTHQPISSNEIIIELYNNLPPIYDGWSGFRIVTVSDIVLLFTIFEIPKKLWDDFYQRLMFFISTVVELKAKKREMESNQNKNKGKASAKAGPVRRGRIGTYKK